MKPTFRLGRLAGIDIGINWSWVVVVALIGWSLADGVFPETNPGLSDGTYAAMAGVAVPLFFACLLAHELGHAVRARQEGMAIEGITLWVFGGVAQFRGAFPSAGAEFRIAIAGPIVSLLLGVVFIALAVAVPLPSAVDGVVHWLGYINLVLLAFNLLPAIPLDGGRVLRSALWAAKHNFAAATRTATVIGRGFGQALIAGGVALTLLTGTVGGLWLALIGWFVLGAAAAEAAGATAQIALAGLRVGDVMARAPVTVRPDLPVERFLDDVFLAHRFTAYPVVDDGGRPTGLISFRAVARPPHDSRPREPVGEHMVPLEQALVVRPDDPLAERWPELLATPLRRALVVHGERLVGLLSATDVLRVIEVAERRGVGLRAARPAGP